MEEANLKEVEATLSIYALKRKIIDTYGFDSPIYISYRELYLSMTVSMDKPTFSVYIDELEKVLSK